MGREAKAVKDRTIRISGEVIRGTAAETKATAGTVERLNRAGLIAPSQDANFKLAVPDSPNTIGYIQPVE